MMYLCYYNALPSATNIYSLSQFETHSKRGCVISTSRNLNIVMSKKKGEVHVKQIKPHNLTEIDIQSHSSVFFKGFLYISFSYRYRRDLEYVYCLVTMKDRRPEMFTAEVLASVDLNFVPYKILFVNNRQKVIEEQNILMVCGNNTINLYDPETLAPLRKCGLAVDNFLKHRTPVTAFTSTWHINEYLVAIGCQNGDVSFLIYENESMDYKSTLNVSVDGPVSSLVLFEIETEIADLLVVSAVGYCIVFRDILQNHLEKRVVIRPKSQDAITCAVAADVDFDGQKELILGSFSKEIYCFKITGSTSEELWKIELMTPIFCLCDIDINKDGINELVVVSMNGLSIFIPDHKLALNKLRAVTRYLQNN